MVFTPAEEQLFFHDFSDGTADMNAARWAEWAQARFGNAHCGKECSKYWRNVLRNRLKNEKANERRKLDPDYNAECKANGRARSKKWRNNKQKRKEAEDFEELTEMAYEFVNNDDASDGETEGDNRLLFRAVIQISKTEQATVKAQEKTHQVSDMAKEKVHIEQWSQIGDTKSLLMQRFGTPMLKERKGKKPPASEPSKKTKNRMTFASRQTSRASFASPPSKKKGRSRIPPRTEPKATRKEHRTSFSLRSCDSDSDESFDRGFSPRRSFYNQATCGPSPGVDDVSSPTPTVAGGAASAPASAKRKMSPPKAVDVETVHSRNLSFGQPAPKSTGAKRMRRNDWTGSPAPVEQKKPLFGGGWPGTTTKGPSYGFPVNSVPANPGGLFGGNNTAGGGFGVENTHNTGGFFGAGVQGSAPAAGFDVETPGGVFGENTAAGFFGAGVQGSAPAAGFDVGTPGGVFGGNTAAGFNPFSPSAP